MLLEPLRAAPATELSTAAFYGFSKARLDESPLRLLTRNNEVRYAAVVDLRRVVRCKPRSPGAGALPLDM
ncbi:hypothetical protein EVAR_35198_1 [Eumeta japonica]|uniref:Uncharacterized protein n=1 Tax=Eumeta variegata TaxID=151549 RepID=A0A4C1VFZ0_EUMVA|nr:hypothetical protein EVAR_35198_1 [Eumeta japonica]